MQERINKGKKVWIAYATKCGSTAEIAEVLAGCLGALGWSVDLINLALAAEPDGYNAVILGNAVRKSAWLPEAIAFVRKHYRLLRQVPVAIFYGAFARYGRLHGKR
jgi:menaquinone-dependent protoporphyrinogen oxidase